MTTQIIKSPTDECGQVCQWVSPETGQHIHTPEVFAGLRNVTTGQLNEVMSGFTADDWDHLAQGFLDQIAFDVLGYLDTLGFDFNPDTDDALTVFWHLYRRYDQTLPMHQQTTGGTR